MNLFHAIMDFNLVERSVGILLGLFVIERKGPVLRIVEETGFIKLVSTQREGSVIQPVMTQILSIVFYLMEPIVILPIVQIRLPKFARMDITCVERHVIDQGAKPVFSLMGRIVELQDTV